MKITITGPQLVNEKFIYETVIYCGAMKTYRVLNLTTGTLYSPDYGTLQAAISSIEDGQARAGATVKRVNLADIITVLNVSQ